MLNNLILPTSKNTNSGNTEIKLNNNSIIFIGANGAGMKKENYENFRNRICL